MSKIHVLETWWIHRLVILLLPGLNELHVGGAAWRILNSTLRCHVRRRIRIPLNTKQEDITTFIKMNSFVSSGGKMLIYKKGSQISLNFYTISPYGPRISYTCTECIVLPTPIKRTQCPLLYNIARTQCKLFSAVLIHNNRRHSSILWNEN